MSAELDTLASAAVRMHSDGRVELVAELGGETSPTRSTATAHAAAGQLAGFISAAVGRAGQMMTNRQIDGLVVTVQVRQRNLSLQELAERLLRPGSDV